MHPRSGGSRPECGLVPGRTPPGNACIPRARARPCGCFLPMAGEQLCPASPAAPPEEADVTCPHPSLHSPTGERARRGPGGRADGGTGPDVTGQRKVVTTDRGRRPRAAPWGDVRSCVDPPEAGAGVTEAGAAFTPAPRPDGRLWHPPRKLPPALLWGLIPPPPPRSAPWGEGAGFSCPSGSSRWVSLPPKEGLQGKAGLLPLVRAR